MALGMGLINIIIALIVIGVIVWAARKLIALIPMDGWIKQVIDVIIVVVVVLAIVFYVIIPLLTMLGGSLHMPVLH
jgi:hypothetical protein